MEESKREEKRALTLTLFSIFFIFFFQKALMFPSKYFLNLNGDYFARFFVMIISGLVGYLIIAFMVEFDEARDSRLFFRKVAYVRFLLIGATLPLAASRYFSVTAPPTSPTFGPAETVMTWIIMFLTIFSIERLFYAEVASVISYKREKGIFRNPREYYLDLLAYGFEAIDPAMVAGTFVIAGLLLVFINLLGQGIANFVNSFSDFLFYVYAFPFLLPPRGEKIGNEGLAFG